MNNNENKILVLSYMRSVIFEIVLVPKAEIQPKRGDP